MFVIKECNTLKKYDLFVEEFAIGSKKDDLYPRCEGELKNVPLEQIPSGIRSEIENQHAISFFVVWCLDLNEKKDIIGRISFVIEAEEDCIFRNGDFDDWKEFQKLKV